MKNPSEILVKQATVVDPNSPFHKKKVDILISNGTILEISTKIESKENMKIIKMDKGYVCLVYLTSQQISKNQEMNKGNHKVWN